MHSQTHAHTHSLTGTNKRTHGGDGGALLRWDTHSLARLAARRSIEARVRLTFFIISWLCALCFRFAFDEVVRYLSKFVGGAALSSAYVWAPRASIGATMEKERDLCACRARIRRDHITTCARWRGRPCVYILECRWSRECDDACGCWKQADRNMGAALRLSPFKRDCGVASVTGRRQV